MVEEISLEDLTSMQLGELPWIDPTAQVTDSKLGPWTAVGARTTISETVFGSYSYVMNDSSIVRAEVGKFCSIAAHTCINPGNHPMWRATQHHFTYRSPSYKLARDEDHAFFQWRRDHKVLIGHDVWIGHGAIILAGIEVGTGAVIGAGAVVTRHVSPYTIVAGESCQDDSKAR